jgi:hypothetical protein
MESRDEWARSRVEVKKQSKSKGKTKSSTNKVNLLQMFARIVLNLKYFHSLALLIHLRFPGLFSLLAQFERARVRGRRRPVLLTALALTMSTFASRPAVELQRAGFAALSTAGVSVCCLVLCLFDGFCVHQKDRRRLAIRKLHKRLKIEGGVSFKCSNAIEKTRKTDKRD